MAFPSLRPGSALRDTVFDGRYTRRDAADDGMAGLTLGIIVIPFAMALAVASGLPPQHGLYTAMIGGALIALLGGSRFSVSGPAVAFVIILYPTAQQFGLAGVMTASLMAGVMQILMGVSHTGRLLAFIPRPVTMGFTAGIAVTIAGLQVGDFLGLGIVPGPEPFVPRLMQLLAEATRVSPQATAIGVLTFAVMALWPRLRTRIPPHLPGLIFGSVAALILVRFGWPVETVGSRFGIAMADGSFTDGIPAILPTLDWPWRLPGADGAPMDWSYSIVQALIPPAVALAVLGGIESLMCAVVLDDMTDTQHRSSEELLAQGIGNTLLPFVAGLPAAANVTSSATGLRANARSPLAAIVHAGVVALGLLVLAPLLAYLPLAALAALMLRVAWTMTTSQHMIELVRRSPPSDTAVFATCFGLTLCYDMIVAIGVGIVMAATLFIRDIARMTKVSDISTHRRLVPKPIPEGWVIYKINGPLFFAAADRVFNELERQVSGRRGLVLYMDNVPLIDAGGLAALRRFREHLKRRGVRLVIADLQFQALRAFARAGVQPVGHSFLITSTLAEAVDRLTSGELDPEAVAPDVPGSVPDTPDA